MAEKKNPHAGHRERVRKRYRTGGLEPFAQHEVLEFLLFSYIPRADTNPLAHRLLEQIGELIDVLSAPTEKLTEVPGVGWKTADRLSSLKPVESMRITEHFRTTSHPLGIYDIVFLTDWFLPPEKGSIGLILCDPERHFLRYTDIFLPPEDNFPFALAREIVKTAKSKMYFLLVREEHPLLSPDIARLLRTITAEGQAWMLDAFTFHRCRPTSLLYPGEEKQWEEP